MRSDRRPDSPGGGRAPRVAAGAAALALLLAGCGEGSDSASSVRELAGEVEYSLDGTTLRLGAAQEQALGVGTSYMVEILEEWGAQVELIELTNLSGLEAMVADEIDMAGRSSDEFLRALDEDVEVQALGEPNSSMHYALVSESGIDDVADLEGRDIAISGSGGFDTFLLRHLLPQEGLDPDEDVNFVPIGGSGERTSALVAGQASASIVFMDNWVALENQGADLQLTGYIEDLVPGLSARTYYAPDEFVEDNPDLAEAVGCANLIANRHIVDDKDAFVDYTTDNVRGTQEEETAAFHEAALELEMYPTEPDQLLQAEKYAELGDMLAETGELSEGIDVEAAIDDSHLRAAAEKGCGA